MHFGTKSYLKNTNNHTVKHAHMTGQVRQKKKKICNIRKNVLCGEISFDIFIIKLKNF
jgi:hypothetical protein